MVLLIGVPEQRMHTCCGLTSVVNLCLLQAAVLISPTTALIQVFNVSHNNLTGSVPSFLASSKVPSYTKQGISLVVMLPVSPQLATLPFMWRTGSSTFDHQPPCFSPVVLLAPVFLSQSEDSKYLFKHQVMSHGTNQCLHC